MKKTVLMAVVIMMTPILTSAQSRWSVSPAIGYYKAELDAISDGLSQAQTIGATVQKPNGGFHFGGRVHYEKSPRWSWLAEVGFWKDKGAGSLQNESITDQVRLVPIMVGSQYYFSRPAAKTRFYGGATGGLVLVNVESEYRLGTLSQTADLSGNSFVTKPFVGLEIANTSKMSFWGELGYMLGKYTIEATNADTGAKIEEDVSINGIHVTGGVKFRL